ncbi:flagellar motor protein MotB [Tepidicella xavieri]|uniref:Chemotaxis protein MotB n=1 Tax=Tepidicella xavieri TaxID=360241 RepID=A0A4V3D5L3_9BURK|nr:flagellar motor protein MotB [Tepidicella xavieri]TDQ40587.1 chemotaxis protein MotB [Tepidicella xavieri]
MAASGKPLQPIIIKRVKKGGHGAHGGAWKIAYADFVTAMMAFFLLMWLLGSTTEADRKGISDYFNAPLMVTLFGGPGSGASDSILPGGGDDLTRTTGEMARGDAQLAARELGAQVIREEAMRLERQRIEGLRNKIETVINNNIRLSEFRDQIRMEMVQDGLNIQIVDDQNRAMFDVGSALVRPYMREILREIGAALAEVDNRISISGHTDATPYGSGARGYSNWELSADRANASRRELVAAGLPDEKLARVVGMGSSQPLLADRPFDPVNRRISILVLTQEAEERMAQGYRLSSADLQGGGHASSPGSVPEAGALPLPAPMTPQGPSQ